MRCRSLHCHFHLHQNSPQPELTSTRTHLHQNSPQPELTEIDLSYNLITDVNFSVSDTQNSSRQQGLRHLNLNHNLIMQLSNATFISSTTDQPALTRLEVLLLGYNHIRSLSPRCFEPLVNLQWLSLTGNRLTSLPEGMFSGLRSLTYLTLDRNWLSEVTDWWNQSPSMTSLVSLNLATNRIEHVINISFVPIALSLQQLNLGFNRMRLLPTDALRIAKFRRLRQLTLDGNPVTTLTTRCLERFAVAELRLSHMPSLIAVERDAFFDVRGLEDIRMHDNPHLVYVDPDMVARTKAPAADGGTSDQDLGTSDEDVKFLRLHRNRISVLESLLTPDRMPRLEMLSLYGNPLSCGCHSDWIREELRVNKSQRLRLTSDNNPPEMIQCTEDRIFTSATTSDNTRITQSITPIRHQYKQPSTTFPPPSSAIIESNSSFAPSNPPTELPVVAMTSSFPVVNSTTSVDDVLKYHVISADVECLPLMVVSKKYVYTTVSDVVELDCHIVGRSTGSDVSNYWVLPGGKVINSTRNNNSRVRMTSSSGSLLIVNVKPSDSGKYTCTAPSVTSTLSSVNDVSLATAIRLIVYSASARLMIVATGNDYVSVTWVDIEPTVTVGSARYAIVYRPLPVDKPITNARSETNKSTLKNEGDYNDDVADDDTGYYDDADADGDGVEPEVNRSRQIFSPRVASNNQTWCTSETGAPHQGECLRGVNLTDSRSSSRPSSYRKVIDVRPYMRGYWIGGLTPMTRYEFCVGIIRHAEHDTDAAVGFSPSSSLSAVQLINCSVAVTTSKNSKSRHRFGEQMFVDDLEESDLIVVAVTAGVFAIVCLIPGLIGLLSALVRRHRRRMDYVEPSQQDGLSQHVISYQHGIGLGVDPEYRVSVSELDTTTVTFNIESSIPLDELHRGSSAQLLASTTSLIS